MIMFIMDSSADYFLWFVKIIIITPKLITSRCLFCPTNNPNINNITKEWKVFKKITNCSTRKITLTSSKIAKNDLFQLYLSKLLGSLVYKVWLFHYNKSVCMSGSRMRISVLWIHLSLTNFSKLIKKNSQRRGMSFIIDGSAPGCTTV